MVSENLDSLHEVIWGSVDRFQKDETGTYPRCVSAWLEAKLEWSEHESFALVQRQGGPCALLAPIQAYIVMALKDKDVEGTRESCRASLVFSFFSQLEYF